MSEVALKRNSPNGGTQPFTVPDGTPERTVRYSLAFPPWSKTASSVEHEQSWRWSATC